MQRIVVLIAVGGDWVVKPLQAALSVILAGKTIVLLMVSIGLGRIAWSC